MKRLLTILCIAACLFGGVMPVFAAEDVKSSDAYINYGSSFESLIQQLVAYSDEELEELKNTSTSEQDIQLVESWMSVKDNLGAYIGVLECEADESKTSLTVTMKFDFTDRDITMVYTSDSNGVNISFDKVLTKMEILKKAGMNTLIGMGTVFIVLIFMSFVIGAFGFIPKLLNKNTKTAEAVAEKKAEIPAVEAEEDMTDDLELVAVITAAIASAEGTSADGVVIRSIKRADNAKWKRA